MIKDVVHVPVFRSKTEGRYAFLEGVSYRRDASQAAVRRYLSGVSKAWKDGNSFIGIKAFELRELPLDEASA
ncbi:MAG: hypothetical protein AAF604_04755 [Acidobacteriota bacterium]